jgi:predicted nucleic-acid-binding Zn-ribbon protein
LRRPLTLIALGLFLLGLEVATGAVFLALARLGTGMRAVLAGDEFLVSTPRYLVGLALVLAGVGLYGGVYWADLMKLRVVVGGEVCPKCGTNTRRVRRRSWHRALAKVFDVQVTRRHCERCGWSGLAT